MSALLMMCAAVSVNAQYQEPYENQQGPSHYDQPQRPLPVILMHKQALAQDGSFNYAFAADNGLQQGESISPDGTRRGSYSYVDPNGKKISVKYTAGKEGFRILEGDHLPKAPPAPVAAAPAPVPQGAFAPRPSHYSAAPSYPTTGYQGAGTNAVFRAQEGGPYYKVYDEYENKSAFKSPYQATAPASFPAAEQRRPPTQYGRSNAQPDAEGRQEPHTFGGGYAFQFSG
ncbi:larval cuticle protein 1 [Cryptotermes secundus]|nr:larval cuticle protein 1 [Cryptotermes secundus]